ncbi:MAG: RelA/SpoT domain-containing protein [Proteobacteria bacterium]|nr:RelA/SpoT domain-containing protein [Pseudomonadota bacterium]
MSIQEKRNRNDLPNVDHFVNQYNTKKPLYEQFTGKLKELLKDLLKTCSIDIHLIDGRTKNTESFREKINRSTKKYVDPTNEVKDLSGIRIIVYYEEDLNIVCRLIEKEFEIDKSNSLDKRTILKPEEFGYESIHFVVKLSIQSSL